LPNKLKATHKNCVDSQGKGRVYIDDWFKPIFPLFVT